MLFPQLIYRQRFFEKWRKQCIDHGIEVMKLRGGNSTNVGSSTGQAMSGSEEEDQRSVNFLDQESPQIPWGIWKGGRVEELEGGKGRGRGKPKESGKPRRDDRTRTRS